jgi:DNA-binding MarR family transcriptional regulator
MEQQIANPTAKWLRRRDAWMRMLVSDTFVSRNGKLAGVYLALRMSGKRPFTYPAMKSMAKDLNVSVRQVARALKELEGEEYLRVRRNKGRTSSYSLNL